MWLSHERGIEELVTSQKYTEINEPPASNTSFFPLKTPLE
jgi:hypothetical protein